MTKPGMDGPLVAVTGGAGFIGSHTVDRLVEEGCRVVVVDDFSTGKWENLARWRRDPRVEIMPADIVDGLAAPLAPVTRRCGPIERIVHLAARVSVVQSIESPIDDVRVNCGGTVEVLEYARRAGVKKVVFSSSSAVYGEVSEHPVSESHRCQPVSPYGIDKLGSEYFLHYYSLVHAVPTTALRFFNVYGPRQDPHSPYSGVISIFATRASAGEPLTIYGDGEQTRDFVYVEDVSRAVVAACLSDSGDRAIANIATGRETSVNELAATIVRQGRSSSSIRHAEARPGEIVRSVAAVGRAAKIFGFRAAVSLRVGLAETLAWAVTHQPVAAACADPS